MRPLTTHYSPTVQFDKTHIAIRERSFLELLDLALRVVQAHFGPLCLTLAVGALPFALLNHWLLAGWLHEGLDSNYAEKGVFTYLYLLALLVIWEMPLAAAPTTLYLGLALFHEKPSARQIAGDLLRSSPQLFLCQVILRGLCIPLVITWFVLFAVWPYLNEIILLERNPLRRNNKVLLSTFGRNSNLHSSNGGELFGRWVISTAIGAVWIGALWCSTWYLRGELTGNWSFDRPMYTVYLQLAIWPVLGYFTVVRYLSYLDFRIKSEGWEVELRMRAEAARLGPVRSDLLFQYAGLNRRTQRTQRSQRGLRPQPHPRNFPTRKEVNR